MVTYLDYRTNERWAPRTRRAREFDRAWDAVITRPTNVDFLSSRGLHRDNWLRESRQTGEPALEWLERTTRPTSNAHRIGEDWPHRDDFDRPEMRADVRFFDEGLNAWRDGTLIANLGGSHGNGFYVRILDGKVNGYWTWEATWLVDRLDLDYLRPAHELRGMTRGSSGHPPSIRRVLFIMKESGLLHVADFLDEHGPDVTDWLEVEPQEWGRLAPLDPYEPAGGGSTTPPPSTASQPDFQPAQLEQSFPEPADPPLPESVEFNPMFYLTDVRAVARDAFVAELSLSLSADQMYESWIGHVGQLKSGGALAGRLREAESEKQLIVARRDQLHTL